MEPMRYLRVRVERVPGKDSRDKTNCLQVVASIRTGRTLYLQVRNHPVRDSQEREMLSHLPAISQWKMVRTRYLRVKGVKLQARDNQGKMKLMRLKNDPTKWSLSKAKEVLTAKPSFRKTENIFT